MKNSLATVLYELENQLLQPEVRQSPEDIDRLLANEFMEFGSSGSVYRKAECLTGLSTPRMSISDFDAKLLAQGVALTTCRVVKCDESDPHMKHSLRSSIWKLMDGRWQMVFHQGTPTTAPEE